MLFSGVKHHYIDAMLEFEISNIIPTHFTHVYLIIYISLSFVLRIMLRLITNIKILRL